MFEFLASAATERAVAWDCATGNGQAAVALTDHFSTVIATDASAAQIDAALQHPRVSYRVASAERSGLADKSVDIITVGQAVHWFDQATFFDEARRVLQSSGVLAIWCYETCHVGGRCDAVIDELYRGIVGEFWPPERVQIERRYGDLRMPGAPIAAPDIAMSLQWTAADMLGYLRTWSACKRYETANGSDPVAQIQDSLLREWGNEKRTVHWPMNIKASRVNTLLE